MDVFFIKLASRFDQIYVQVFKVRATAGNSHLRGENIDSRLVSYFIAEFLKIHSKISHDISLITAGNQFVKSMMTSEACYEIYRNLQFDVDQEDSVADTIPESFKMKSKSFWSSLFFQIISFRSEYVNLKYQYFTVSFISYDKYLYLLFPLQMIESGIQEQIEITNTLILKYLQNIQYRKQQQLNVIIQNVHYYASYVYDQALTYDYHFKKDFANQQSNISYKQNKAVQAQLHESKIQLQYITDSIVQLKQQILDKQAFFAQNSIKLDNRATQIDEFYNVDVYSGIEQQLKAKTTEKDEFSVEKLQKQLQQVESEFKTIKRAFQMHYDKGQKHIQDLDRQKTHQQQVLLEQKQIQLQKVLQQEVNSQSVHLTNLRLQQQYNQEKQILISIQQKFVEFKKWQYDEQQKREKQSKISQQKEEQTHQMVSSQLKQRESQEEEKLNMHALSVYQMEKQLLVLNENLKLASNRKQIFANNIAIKQKQLITEQNEINELNNKIDFNYEQQIKQAQNVILNQEMKYSGLKKERFSTKRVEIQ
ncbi:Cytosolic_heat shock protein 70 [Hexamita inflata]|uniref:Cytosolic heat shock protein 70 n=1 Tax=Hexamita inflata TaxID=28002 RepID=A0AA86QFN1_9EUKA|nr:Cytosolic heat shock protein 70 [Hexamita inflata]